MAHRPRRGSLGEKYWDDGAAAEAAARDEGLNDDAVELRRVLESFARLKPDAPAEEIVRFLRVVYCPTLTERLMGRRMRPLIDRELGKLKEKE
jgi:hypothetical protein